ncbi:hypothetical protein RN001_016233 [Aquatica leii]|uniref:Uncharacterized protein n=1 Tax=Aquatica leii TaxID=1421715 RepID=A0AAN7NXP2_9COLE|nr:hypothetical protein RN001_016233 [Aquatica leii]
MVFKPIFVKIIEVNAYNVRNVASLNANLENTTRTKKSNETNFFEPSNDTSTVFLVFKNIAFLLACVILIFFVIALPGIVLYYLYCVINSMYSRISCRIETLSKVSNRMTLEEATSLTA